MSWDRPTASAALVAVLGDALDDLVTVHPRPPSSLNAPAMVVSYPTTVVKHSPSFAVDQASLAVLGVAGVDDGDGLDYLLATATAAIEADPSLGGQVQLAVPTEWRNWRVFNSAGANLLVAELAVDIRM